MNSNDFEKLKRNEDVCMNEKCDGIMVKQDKEEDGKKVWICRKCGVKELID